MSDESTSETRTLYYLPRNVAKLMGLTRDWGNQEYLHLSNGVGMATNGCIIAIAPPLAKIKSSYRHDTVETLPDGAYTLTHRYPKGRGGCIEYEVGGDGAYYDPTGQNGVARPATTPVKPIPLLDTAPRRGINPTVRLGIDARLLVQLADAIDDDGHVVLEAELVERGSGVYHTADIIYCTPSDVANGPCAGAIMRRALYVGGEVKEYPSAMDDYVQAMKRFGVPAPEEEAITPVATGADDQPGNGQSPSTGPADASPPPPDPRNESLVRIPLPTDSQLSRRHPGPVEVMAEMLDAIDAALLREDVADGELGDQLRAARDAAREMGL